MFADKLFYISTFCCLIGIVSAAMGAPLILTIAAFVAGWFSAIGIWLEFKNSY